MTDEQCIANLVHRYGYLIDAGDFEGVGRHLAHALLTAEGQPLELRGADAIAKYYANTTRIHPETGTPRTKHVFTNMWIEIDDEGERARSETNYLVLQQTQSLPLQPIITGRYHHRYEKHEGEWRIVAKRFFVDQIGDLSEHLLFELKPGSAARPADGD